MGTSDTMYFITSHGGFQCLGTQEPMYGKCTYHYPDYNEIEWCSVIKNGTLSTDSCTSGDPKYDDKEYAKMANLAPPKLISSESDLNDTETLTFNSVPLTTASQTTMYKRESGSEPIQKVNVNFSVAQKLAFEIIMDLGGMREIISKNL